MCFLWSLHSIHLLLNSGISAQETAEEANLFTKHHSFCYIIRNFCGDSDLLHSKGHISLHPLCLRMSIMYDLLRNGIGFTFFTFFQDIVNLRLSDTREALAHNIEILLKNVVKANLVGFCLAMILLLV